MITAVLTRPSPITPTQSCEYKLGFLEKVDIGAVPVPQPRTIFLEPITKSKKRKSPHVDKGTVPGAPELAEPVTSDRDSMRAAENSTEGSIADDMSQDVQYSVRSPNASEIRSENSGETHTSGSTGRSGKAPDVSNGLQPGPVKKVANNKTITATVEILRGGSIPGDVIPIRVSVQHIKKIKSLFGVIVTLFRQGRIDFQPPISLFGNLSKEEARRLERDEYYPKSKTGLGGLSLTSAGSCSVFRKDLSQVFAPLIIDPVTLKSSVTTHIRLPEDVFPTLKGLPGEIISFKYQVEVILDLGGKLASLLQAGQAKANQNAPNATVLNPYDPATGLASMSRTIVDTNPMRRQKGVVHATFEVVVGNVDTSRQRGRGHSRPEPIVLVHDADMSLSNGEQRTPGIQIDAVPVAYDLSDETPFYSESFPPYPEEVAAPRPAYMAPPPLAPEYVPSPEVANDAELSEKERVRRAEERLLPSQPVGPSLSEAGPSNSRDDEDDIYHTEGQPSAPPLLAQGQPQSDNHAPTAPSIDDFTPAAAATHPTEDKQELERRRLLEEASAPPEFPDDYDAGVGSSSLSHAGPSAPTGPSAPPTAAPTGPTELEPSAPVINEEDNYGTHYTYPIAAASSSAAAHPSSAPAEPLPKYER
jgi:arrestin-related trafficking adapter 9